jgi:hypothetical protein
LAYAAGAATSLALALLVGGQVFAAMKRSLGIGEWVRRGVGVAVLAGVAAIALGLDTGFLSRVSYASTASIEQKLLDGLHPAPAAPPQSSAVMNGGAMVATNPGGGDNPAMMMKSNPTEPTVVMNGGPAMVAANTASGDNPAVMTDAKREPSVIMNDSPAMMAANPATMMKAKPSAAEESLPVEGALAVRRGPMAELAAADHGGPQRQSRASRFLDLFLHQLPPSDPLTFAPGPRSTGIRGWW